MAISGLLMAFLLLPVDSTRWKMSCQHYREAVEALYSDPYFSLPQNRSARRDIHEKFKLHTNKLCYGELTYL